jgi:hypothetical protein
MVMDIKPSVSLGPVVRPESQIHLDAAQGNTSGEQEGNATVGSTQITSNTAQAMKNAGIEMKGSMKTTERFLQQALTDQLDRNVKQNGDDSAVLLGSSMMSAQPQNAPAITKSAIDPTATALKEAKVLMDRGVKLLNERRYNEAARRCVESRPISIRPGGCCF